MFLTFKDSGLKRKQAMSKSVKSLFEFYENCDKVSSQITYYDFHSKYLLNSVEIDQCINEVSGTLKPICPLNTAVVCFVKPCHVIPSLILGILKVPLVFSFLDVQSPEVTLKNLQKYVLISALLVEENLLKDLEKLCSCWKEKISKSINTFSFSVLQSVNCKNESCPQSGGKNENCSKSALIAYVMQTSGTTGEPKIVQVPHQCIIPNIVDLKSKFCVTPDDVILLCSPLTFDPSIIDIFLFIASGCKLVIVPDKMKSIPQMLGKVIVENKVTILQGTPSLVSSLGDEFIQTSLLSECSSLKVLAFGGEICPSVKKLQKWTSKRNKTMLFNLYGLTELSCWATCYKIKLDENLNSPAIPLGEPLLETVVKCDDSGELYIGSDTRWCIVNKEKYFDGVNAPLRPTGDMFLKTDDGTLYFNGRKDCVIKFRGTKLAFYTMNNILNEDSDISNFHIHFEKTSSKLLLFLVFKDVSQMIIDKKRYEIVSKIKQSYHKLPPLEVFIVPRIPITYHGKANYKQLLQLAHSNFKSEPYIVTMKNNCSEIISKIWLDYTNQSAFENSNFVLSGGDSISALQLASDIEWTFQKSIPNLIDLLLNSSFKNVVNLVQSYLDCELNSSMKISCDSTSKEETSLLPFKRQKKNTNSKNNKCFQIFAKHGCLLQCNCLKFHHLVDTISMPKMDLSENKLSLHMLFKIDLKKCIDATPCVVHFFECNTTYIFIGSHFGVFCCINVLKGCKEWEAVLPDRIESSACLSSCGNFVLVGCYDYHLYCFSSKHGQVLWKFNTGAEIKSSPVVSSQNIIFVGSHDKHLYAIKSSGEMMWKNKFAEGSVFSSPALCEEYNGVVVGSLDGTLSFLNMDSGEIIWSYNYGKPLFSSPKIFSSMIYIGSADGCMLCYDIWGNLKFKITTDGPIFSSVGISLSSNTGILFGCHDCNVYCISENANLKWKFRCNSPVYATPFPFEWENKHYVVVASTAGVLYILQAMNGELITSCKCTGEIFSSPLFFNGSLFIGCRDDHVYCFKLQ